MQIAKIMGPIDDPKLPVAGSGVEDLFVRGKDNEGRETDLRVNRNNVSLSILDGSGRGIGMDLSFCRRPKSAGEGQEDYHNREHNASIAGIHDSLLGDGSADQLLPRDSPWLDRRSFAIAGTGRSCATKGSGSSVIAPSRLRPQGPFRIHTYQTPRPAFGYRRGRWYRASSSWDRLRGSLP